MVPFVVALAVMPGATAVIAAVYLVQYRAPRESRWPLVAAHFLAVTAIIATYGLLCVWAFRPGWWQYPGWVVFAAGAFVFWYAVRCHPTCLVPDDDRGVVKAGPYRYIRHPIYAGGLLGALGLVAVAPSWQVALVWLELTVCLAVLAKLEETELRGRLGVRYGEYQRGTRLLVPGVL
ncbi:methyltransferase family protein [Amycolatopsis lurida]